MLEPVSVDDTLMDVDIDTVCYGSDLEDDESCSLPQQSLPLNLMSLPDDTVHKILSHLPMKEKLHNLPLVCKRMNVLLKRPSEMWEEVDTYTVCHFPVSDAGRLSEPALAGGKISSVMKLRHRQHDMLRWLTCVGPSVTWLKAAFAAPCAQDQQEAPALAPESTPAFAQAVHLEARAGVHPGFGAADAMQLDEVQGPRGPGWSLGDTGTPLCPFFGQGSSWVHSPLTPASLHASYSTGDLYMGPQGSPDPSPGGWTRAHSGPVRDPHVLSRSKSSPERSSFWSQYVPGMRLMPLLAQAFGSMRQLRKLEVDYVNAENCALLCNLTNLTALSMGQLDDCAKILAKHGNFPNLRELRLVNVRDNNESQGVSKGCVIFSYPQLRKLELFDAITDITCCISTLTALTELRIANLLPNCKMTVATEMGSLTQLRVFYLHAEHGCDLPAALSSLTQLSKLGLAGNINLRHLDGRIKNLAQLRTLYLANMTSVLWEHVLPQFQSLPKLDTLSFEGCRLETLPACVLLSTNLRAMNLHNNLLEDLPHGPYLHRLQSIDISHNYLDRVPSALATAPELQWLDLSYNSNQARTYCLQLDAEAVAMLTAAKQLQYCALVRYDDKDKSEKLAEEYYRPWDNHELSCLLQLTHALAARNAFVDVHRPANNSKAAQSCKCTVCAYCKGKCRKLLPPAWF